MLSITWLACCHYPQNEGFLFLCPHTGVDATAGSAVDRERHGAGNRGAMTGRCSHAPQSRFPNTGVEGPRFQLLPEDGS